MGYQESLIKFKDEKVLIQELKKYSKRDNSSDLAEIVCVDIVKKDIYPFKKGELVAVVCGERSEQRTKNRLREGLGIDNFKEIVFIDMYWKMAEKQGIDLGVFLGKYFEKLSEDEYRLLLTTG